jgi:uncharacterized membrane protein
LHRISKTIDRMKAYTLLYGSTILLTGLLAGLFYGYSCSVNKGLGNLPDEHYLRAFQSINRAILNPAFFLSFAGSLALLGISVLVSHLLGHKVTFYCALGALVIYLLGVAGVTMAGNVPLNEELERMDLSSVSAEAISAMRSKFEYSWNKYHAIRTVASVLSFGGMLLGILLTPEK